MSNLQIGLAIAGGLVLAGVVAHSAWSARKNQPKLATPEAPVDEPTTPAAGHELSERQEPSFDGDAGLASLSNFALLPTLEKKPGLDALIDVIAPVAIEGEVSGGELASLTNGRPIVAGPRITCGKSRLGRLCHHGHKKLAPICQQCGQQGAPNIRYFPDPLPTFAARERSV